MRQVLLIVKAKLEFYSKIGDEIRSGISRRIVVTEGPPKGANALNKSK